jgi:L-iditol 2-dehydrogenase
MPRPHTPSTLTTSMRVAATDGAGGLVVAERPLPIPPPGGAIVRVLACGLCGSDLEKLDGGTGAGLVLGHEVVGLLERPGEAPVRVALAHHVPCGECPACRRGHSSLCDRFVTTHLDPGGFAEWLAVSPDHLADVVFPLPDPVDDVTGTLLEPLSCVLRALDVAAAAHAMFPDPSVRGRGRGAQGSASAHAPASTEAPPATSADGAAPGLAAESGRPPQVLVAGCGSVGLLFLSVLALTEPDSKLTFLERDLDRAALAGSLGALPSRGEPTDLAFVTAPAALPEVVESMAPGGVVVVFAADGTTGAGIDLEAVYRRELTLVGVRSGSPGHLRRGLDLLSAGRLDLGWLRPEVVGLDGLAEAVCRYRTGETLKVVAKP